MKIKEQINDSQSEIGKKNAEILGLNEQLFAAHRASQSLLAQLERCLTGQKWVQEQMADSEVRYRRLFEAARDGILILDAVTCKIIDVNPFMVELLGYTREEFLGKELFEIGLLKDAAASQAMYAELQKTGYLRYEDLPLETKAGERVAVEFVSNVYPENERQVIQCNIRDITERKHTAEASTRLAAIVESSEDAIISKTLDGIITSWNAGAEKLYGYTAQEVIGRPVSFLAPSELPDEMAELLEKIRHGEQVKQYETVRVRKDGSRFDISLSISPLKNAEGVLIGASSVKRDITERKRSEAALQASEERFHAFMDNTPARVFIKDEEGRYVYLNKAVELLTHTPLNELLGKTNYDRLPEETARQLRANDVQVLTSGQAQQFEELVPDYDGNLHHELVVKFPLAGADGEQLLAGMAVDISARKQSEKALQESQRFLQATLDALASHIAVLDENGKIIAVNQAWRQFSEENGGTLVSCGIGANYFEVCDSTIATWKEEAPVVSQGIREVIAEQQHTFCLEYPCHSPKEERWFNIRVTRFLGDGPVRVVVAHENITARRQAETERRQSATRLANAQRIAHLGSWVWGIKADVLHWSEEVYRIFGLVPQEFDVNYAAFSERIHPDDREAVNKAVQDALAGIAPYNMDHRVCRPDGTEVVVHEQGEVTFDEMDTAVLMTGTVLDITERKHAEEELDRFFTLSLDMLAIIGSDGYMKRLNPAFEGTLGFSNAELMAVPFMEFVHPDDQDITGAGALRLESGLPLTDFENRYRCRDGSYKWLRWTVAPYENLWYCVARDITTLKVAEADLFRANNELEMRVGERTAQLEKVNLALQKKETEQQQVMDTLAESEERFRLLVERVHDYAILMLDTTGHVMTWNTGAEYLKGYKSEEIIGHHFSCFYTEEDQQAGKPEQELEIAKTQGYLDDEGWRVRQDGSRFWAIVVITALRDNSGQLRGFAKVSRDITERKNIEAALRDAKAQADAANQAKSEFLSRMSHELRTPLNAILGFSQLLAKQDFPPAQQERVQHILKAGRHLLDLINEVLEIARIEAGHMLLSLEPVQVRKVVQEVFSLVRPIAAEQDIELRGSEDRELEAYVLADLQRFKQVMLNLCSNAIKYNRPQGTITVTCQTLPGIPSPEDPTPSGQLRINVTDTGIGIAPESQAQLFTPFMRVGAAQTTIEGTGLGLALSLSLIHAMDGTIGVESSVGVGSTFWVQLPLAPAPLMAADDALAHGDALPHEVPSSASVALHTLLYIEDNLSNLQLIEAIIADHPGYELISAMQGQMGLDLARQHHPNLILLDLHLPDVPGDQVLARLKAEPATASIPVVMLSAVAAESEIKRLLEGGAVAYLTKPLDIALFLDTLNTILQPTKGSR